MKKPLIIAVMLSAISFAALAAGTVEVHIAGNEKTLTLTHAERLADLVRQPRLAGSWWPGAVITSPMAAAKAGREHQALLAELAALAVDEGGSAAGAINALRNQLQAIPVTGRLLVPLDPDTVRVHNKNNPPLEGNYTLWLGREPSTVTLVGLVDKPGKMPFTPGRDAASYLDDVSLLSGADRSYAWVIYPDGRTQKAPVAYWNKRHVEPMPGSILFVGFADSLWTNKYEALNAEILRSLSQRRPE
ncbi:capsule biosynthesis GfcC family protein [Kluyvera sp. EC_51]|uniref:capsule biosynthesis GfcC family protein n=1 Tax=Kluyvera sp. EC_51 TaxID=2584089 RepID=UPI001C6FE65E|nr:capsule biosynthesis GfcC family protein [Kluyvera sp. EC_51]MBW9463175.1 capsule biosynthesis GfcC family protein [Kluyvera sp. EC_51]